MCKKYLKSSSLIGQLWANLEIILRMLSYLLACPKRLSMRMSLIKRLFSCAEDATWFRVPLKKSALVEKEHQLEALIMETEAHNMDLKRAWHGFKVESLASMLKFGLQESSPNVVGSRHQGKGFLYCCGDDFVVKAWGYCNLVPAQDHGIFLSCMWELAVDRWKSLPAKSVGKRDGQWFQPLCSYARRALWIHIVNFKDVPDGQPIQAVWESLFEWACTPHFSLEHSLLLDGSRQK